MGEDMITYRYLHPDRLKETYERVEEYLPNALRDLSVFAGIYSSGTTAFFEVGEFDGVFWLSDIAVGFKANAHIVLWSDDVKKQYPRAKEILRDLFRLFHLKRMQAFIPAKLTKACEFAEALGFQLEGTLRKFDYYGEEAVDVLVYGILNGEV